MKKLINDPRNVVREMLEGYVDLHPELALLPSENVVIRSDLPAFAERDVAVISGGGAGHEPAHAGYVGAGMLDAAVVGEVFTSPSVDAVFAAIQAVAGPKGVVLIIKNYTGDRLNFGLAAEMARVAGTPVEVVIVADDVSLHETVSPERRRGIAGTVLVHKVAGAMAAKGASLEEVSESAHRVATMIGTMGVALGACTVPAAGKPGFVLGDDEIEFGLGIHGEQGVGRINHLHTDALVSELLTTIIEDHKITKNDRVVLLVNNLGGTPPMELSIVARSAIMQLRAAGLVVERAWAGTFLSALEMPGCSLSVLKVDDQTLSLLDQVTSAPAWPGLGHLSTERTVELSSPETLLIAEKIHSHDSLGHTVKMLVQACGTALMAEERQLTDLDSATGDGDLGVSMTRGAGAIRAYCEQCTATDAASVMAGIAVALRRAIAGSSGPFYAIGLLRAARHLAACEEVNAAAWAEAFNEAVIGISELGGARSGDRTMLDALQPAVDAFSDAVSRNASIAEALSNAAKAAEQGAIATAQMLPGMGRASYLGGRALGNKDGGAVAVSIWLNALAEAVTELEIA